MRDIELPSSHDWQLLGIDPTDSLSDGKRKYRLAARANHPDVAAGDGERFRGLAEAWERVEAAVRWRDARGFATAASLEYEEEAFDEDFAPNDDGYASTSRSADGYVTASLLERFVRRTGGALFLAGRFPERDWSALITLLIGACLALVVQVSVHPAALADLLSVLTFVLVVGRIVATPTRLGL